MANFPIPTSGTAWASGGISGKIGGKSMKRSRKGRAQPRRNASGTYVRRGVKPWERKEWLPYIGNHNVNMFNAGDTATRLESAGTAKRVVALEPAVMMEDITGAIIQNTRASDRDYRMLGVDGDIYVGFPFDLQYEPSGAYASDVFIWWSWQKENWQGAGAAPQDPRTFHPAPCAFAGGFANQSLIFMSKHILSHGRVHMSFPGRYNVTDSRYDPECNGGVAKIPLPRMPKAGMKFGPGDVLSLVCSISAGMGHDWQASATGDDTMPYVYCHPFLRFLMAE